MTRPRPDLVILCSRRPNTVTARVVGGMLTWDQGGGGLRDVRPDAPTLLVIGGTTAAYDRVELAGSVPCRCGRAHGRWAPEVLRRLRGTTTTDDVERLSAEFWESLH